jgi:hypothetical protein
MLHPEEIIAPPPKRKRGKLAQIVPVDLAELEHAMPMDYRYAWGCFKSMAQAKRASGRILDTTLAALLQEIQQRCAGMSDAAIAAGLLAAVQARGGGADNARYVALAAAGYDGKAESAPAQPNPADVAREKRRYILHAVAHGLDLTAEQRAWAAANGIPLESPAQLAAGASRARQMREAQAISMEVDSC